MHASAAAWPSSAAAWACCTARMAVLRGCAPVIIIGDNAKRLRIAKEMGADYTIDIQRGEPTRWPK